MSLLLLTKADFTAQLPFSTQIEEVQVQPFVQTAYLLDLLPLLGHATLEAVDLLPAPTLRAYAEGLTIAPGDLLTRQERVYRALVDNPELAPPVPCLNAGPAKDGAAEWGYEPLLTLWTQYLKCWWVQQAFARFLAQHGLHITKAGVTSPNDPAGTYVRPSSADKAALLASVEATADALKARLSRFLRSEHLLYGQAAAYDYCYGERVVGDNPAAGYGYAPASLAATRRHAGRLRGI